MNRYSEFHKVFEIYDYYLQSIIREYSRSDLSEYYVDLKLIDKYGNKAVSSHKCINDWIEYVKEYSNILLLGEFGSGKTSFCRKLAHDFAEKAKVGISKRIPILVELNEFKNGIDDLNKDILDLYKKKYSLTGLSIQDFVNYNRKGYFVFIFDGFDELTLRKKEKIFFYNLNEIFSTIYRKSKLIITCRTEYFRKNDEVLKIFPIGHPKINFESPNFKIFSIQGFKKDAIKQVIKKIARNERKILYNQIKDSEILYELARRPLFLDKIVTTFKMSINTLDVKPNKQIIYQKYINNYLQKLHEKERTIITGEIAVNILEKTAEYLHIKGKDIIELQELKKISLENRKIEEISKKVSINEIIRNITTYTLLRGTKDDGYKFTHSSFLHYFTAKCIFNYIERKDTKIFETQFIGAETILFVVDMLDTGLKDTLCEWLENKSLSLKKYAIIFLGFIEQNLHGNYKEELTLAEKKHIIKIINNIIIDLDTSAKPMKRHIVKHAVMSLCLLNDDRYKLKLNDYLINDNDYTHRWYSILGMEKLINDNRSNFIFFRTSIEYANKREQNSQIRRIAYNILKDNQS